MTQKSTPRAASPGRREKRTPSTSPHHDHFEFGGPLGAALLPVVLVSTIYFLFFGANGKCVVNVSSLLDGTGIKCVQQQVNSLSAYDLFVPSFDTMSWVVGWFMFQVLLERLLPGDICDGTVLRNGEKLKYNVNGHLAFWVSLFVMLHAYPAYAADGKFVGFSRFPLEKIYDNYLDLAKSAMWFSTILSLYLYFKSHAKNALLAEGGNTSNAIYNWFIGRELNPREGNFDWKEFCELRPGLIGWALINIGCACAQYRNLGHVTTPMILVNLFHGMYVWDALYSEQAILTTMDITTDGFGFMLAFGDLAWVPFTYSLQARFLVEHSPNLPDAFWVFVLLVKILGFVIFRGANGEKDQFRRDPTHPSVASIKTLETKRGRKLMITGWWGLARKINYTGDWLMGLAWCLTTGFQTPLTYFYSIYFFILLVHRAWRDDEACLKKYGEEDWAKYKKAVPYIFVPGLI